MKAVGVKVLKAKLSEYLRLVKTGETVLVTERDEVIAELRPAHRQKLSSQNWEEILSGLAEEGRAVLRAEEPRSWKGVSSRIQLPEELLESALNELRGEDGEDS